jgi:hypothetical protein
MDTVDPQTAFPVLSWVGAGITMEDAMRLLYPEEANKIYSPGRWPWGPPQEEGKYQ